MRNLLHRALLALAASILFASSAAAQSETIEYYGLDALGSVRVIFNGQGDVVDRMDYGPFGEALRAGIKFPVEQFAGLARDGESGQDYAAARSYTPSSGRFNRVDPIYAGLFEPQKWNRYTYAVNNPITLSDPSGLDPCEGVWNPETQNTNFSHCNDGNHEAEADGEGTGNFFLWSEWCFLTSCLNDGNSGYGGKGQTALDNVAKDYCKKSPQSCNEQGEPIIHIAGIPNGTGVVIAGTAVAVGNVAQQAGNAVRNVYVYRGWLDGKVVYYGITNNPVRRAAQHLSRFDLDPIVGGLTRLEARAIEQALINKDRGTLLNIINSISPNHKDLYPRAVTWGESVLKALGLW